MTETSKIDQYQREAQTIATDLVAVVPGNTEVLNWDSALGTAGGTPAAEEAAEPTAPPRAPS